MRSLRLVALLGLLLGSFVVAPPAAADPASHGRLVGYYIEWGIYARNYFVKDAETSGSADRLTTINYAFANAAPDGDGNITCQLFDPWADYQVPVAAEHSVSGQAVTWPNRILGNFEQLKELKALHPGLKVVISIGGWTGSKYFSDAALTAESRAKFVSSCIDTFIKGNLPDPGWGGMGGPGAAAGVFDGIDIDWEYPAFEGNPGNIVRPEDTQNFTALMTEFRSQLDTIDQNLILTYAAPAGGAKAAKIEIGKVAAQVDWVNLMAYDFHVASETTTNFNAALKQSPNDPARAMHFNTLDGIQTYLKGGTPSSKLVVGAPFYGHGWTGVPNVNHGLYQSATGPAQGVWEAGSNDYKALAALGWPRYYDNKARDAWIYDAATGTFWTFDDPSIMAQRHDFVSEAGLGGSMFWELSGDTSDGQLIKALAGH